MADEDTTPVATEPDATQPVATDEPHPLAPGGVRFEEVIREKNELKAEVAALRAAATQKPEPVKPAEPMYTVEQMQQGLDAGRITQAQMADRIAWQRGEGLRQQVMQEITLGQRRATALTTVNQYRDHVPALDNPNSSEFVRAARVAADLADELGWDIRDPRLQALALKQVFGPLDKMTTNDRTREYARQHADTAIETRGGGRATAPAADPFKEVPKPLMEEWKRLGYTTEQMKAEMPYIDHAQWKRRHG